MLNENIYDIFADTFVNMDNAGGDDQKLLDAHDQTCIMLAFVWYRDVTYCELLMERIDPSNNTLSTPTLVIFEQSACKIPHICLNLVS